MLPRERLHHMTHHRFGAFVGGRIPRPIARHVAQPDRAANRPGRRKSIRPRLRRSATTALCALAGAASLAVAAPAAQAVNGNVMCDNTKAVVGIWVDGASGDGWAS